MGDMSEEKAVELASKVVSEGFIYGVREPAASQGTGRGEGRGMHLRRRPLHCFSTRVGVQAEWGCAHFFLSLPG